MIDDTSTVTERWYDRLRKAGKQFAEIVTYDCHYAMVAILYETKDTITIQYPLLKFPKGRPPVANPCVLPGVWEVKYVTESIRKDVDVSIRRYK
jgi:hypothetical protein